MKAGPRSRRERILEATAPFFRWLAAEPVVQVFRFLPPLFLIERARPELGAWQPYQPQLPPELVGQPGSKRDEAAITAAFERNGAPRQWTAYYSAFADLLLPHLWRSFLPAAPRFTRALRIIRQIEQRTPSATVSPLGPEELTAAIKDLGRALGISAVGVAPMDLRYINDDYQDRIVGERVIVCALERNFEARQRPATPEFEQASIQASAALMKRMAAIAGRLQDLGYRALPMPFDGGGLVIPFAEQAGLGQLGINGQLLTPRAGSGTSLCMIVTDAPLVVDGPVDYGVTELCNKCRVCVARCPVRAIPAKRTDYGGVTKAKLRTDLCAPVIITAHACGVCMSVCPAQKYGLEAMTEHYRATGKILGKGTEALEGYDWIDGEHYTVGKRPPMPPAAFFEVEALSELRNHAVPSATRHPAPVEDPDGD